MRSSRYDRSAAAADRPAARPALSELSQTLPEVVDRLTPEGRLPTDDEMRHW
jgi:hypothetical protein